jgi:hypothetical protein
MGCNLSAPPQPFSGYPAADCCRALGTLRGPPKGHMLGALGARSSTAH